MVRIPTHRRPVLPGEILFREFLEPLGISQTAFAKRLGITHHRLNEIIRGKRAVTTDTALRLARVLGTTPDVWLNMQQAVDLYDAMHSSGSKEIARLEPLPELRIA
ncbi:MAG: antitoxin HigA [Candidatus Eremiobacteraeota bacterium]|jgi:addiction module HigA family antidote|nr:antitoxin HigA [Candidatus Eremiobacteraeota bacterium]